MKIANDKVKKRFRFSFKMRLFIHFYYFSLKSLIGLFSFLLFNDISTFMGHLMPKPTL